MERIGETETFKIFDIEISGVIVNFNFSSFANLRINNYMYWNARIKIDLAFVDNAKSYSSNDVCVPFIIMS